MEQQPKQEIYSSSEQHEIGEPSAELAVERIKWLYELGGPDIGSRLVEANVVLTLADARGQTESFFGDPNKFEEMGGKLEELSRASEQDGIRFKILKLEHKRWGYPFLLINIESLKGYSWSSKQTKIPGFELFNPASGWDGLKEWKARVRAGLEAAKGSGNLPANADLDHLYTGVIKGYPDTAIYDAVTRDYNPEMFDDADLPFVELYGGADPSYSYLKKHADVPEIREHQEKWRKILEEFYQSEWHQHIKDDPVFLEAREKEQQREEEKAKLIADKIKQQKENQDVGNAS